MNSVSYFKMTQKLVLWRFKCSIAKDARALTMLLLTRSHLPWADTVLLHTLRFSKRTGCNINRSRKACILYFDAWNGYAVSFTSLVVSTVMPCAANLCDRKYTWCFTKNRFLKLMLILHSVKRTSNRSSFVNHSSKLLSPKQISSTSNRRRNTKTIVDSSNSPVTNMLLAGSLPKRCNGSYSWNFQ